MFISNLLTKELHYSSANALLKLECCQIETKPILAKQDNILSNPKTAAAAATANLPAESGVEDKSFQTHREKLIWHTAKN